ncbi:MAG: hypothetical protein VB085_10840 [Peptococcaceae bacterium]|nr:hypothetical protein [Peptococcaceae bacterium]
MAVLPYKVIPEGYIDGKNIPVNVVFVEKRDIQSCGLSFKEAIHKLGGVFEGPVAVNIFDMEAVTTTSDGLMVEGAIVCMGAADKGLVNSEFGILSMAEIEYSDEMIKNEPHLKQWKALFPQRRLFRGPNPADKLIPVHNVVITGRASNNNSATEMMNIVTMEELIFPILGQLTCIKGGEVLVGFTGRHISVGIGMTVAEKFGRVFPHPQFHAGETAHGSGEYAQTLKETIPCIVCSKKYLAEIIIRALACGCVPARELGCSPAVLAVARAMGAEIAVERITPAAQLELDSVGCTREWMLEKGGMSKEEVLARAEELIPGVGEAQKHHTSEFVFSKSLKL